MVAGARAIALQYGLHEMSIAASVLDAIRAESLQHNGAHINRAGLRIGELSGVEIESLRFCLEVLAGGTDLEPLSFELEPVPWTRQCRACGTVFRVIDAQPSCASCASTATDPAGGDQLELSFVELEDT
jgi:hydrogenase nickel incorporation protein HypA/HybF